MADKTQVRNSVSQSGQRSREKEEEEQKKKERERESKGNAREERVVRFEREGLLSERRGGEAAGLLCEGQEGLVHPERGVERAQTRSQGG